MLQVDTRFTANSRTKSVALLRAVGQQGLDFLQSVGFNIIHCIYEEALDFINDNYGEKENTFCKYTKNVFLCQNIDEDEQDYLVKVKRLAGDSDLSTTEQVNNLRNVNLQRESMAKRLDQTNFARILKPRTVASQAVQFFDGDTESTVSIKKTWVQQVTILKSSSNAASNCCNNSSSQFINYMSEAELKTSSKNFNNIHDTFSARRPPGNGG